MIYNSNIHHRRSIRLKNWDYGSPGFYFITICSYGRQAIFGEIINGEMILSELGKIIKEEWSKTPVIRKNIKLMDFIIMPNHIHGIIIITENVNDAVGANRWFAQDENQNDFILSKFVDAKRATQRVAPTPRPFLKSNSLGSIIGQFKSIVTKRSQQNNVWQRNYYDHIIRNEKDLYNIQGYILGNISQWQADLENLQLYKHWTEREREYFVQKHYDELFGK